MRFLDKIDFAREIIGATLNKYDNVAVACSFGKDSMVVLHIALQVDNDIPVFSIMTPFKFNETFEYKDYITKEWGLNLETYMQNSHEKIYLRDVDECCNFYKVEMTKLATSKLDAWICGLRRTEGRTRASYDFFEDKDGLIKVNPILDFTELDVWRYLAIHNIPVNPKYKEGYRSLGCAPCSAIEVDEDETERSGRWQGTYKCGGECGIHTKSLR